MDGAGMTFIFAVMVVGQSFSFTVAFISFDCVKNSVGFLHPLHDTASSGSHVISPGPSKDKFIVTFSPIQMVVSFGVRVRFFGFITGMIAGWVSLQAWFEVALNKIMLSMVVITKL